MPAARYNRLLVDTYNVLHVTGVLPAHLAGPDVGALATLVGNSRWAGVPCWLVCDGPRSQDEPATCDMPPSVKAVYAGSGKDADSRIENEIAADSAPRSLLVVSSDRRIQAAARRRKAAWKSSEDFLRILAHDAQAKQAPPIDTAALAAMTLEDWLDAFDIDGIDGISTSAAPAAKKQANNREKELGQSEQEKPTQPEDWIVDAMAAWPGRIKPAELDDMERWLGLHAPARRRHKEPGNR